MIYESIIQRNAQFSNLSGQLGDDPRYHLLEHWTGIARKGSSSRLDLSGYSSDNNRVDHINIRNL